MDIEELKIYARGIFNVHPEEDIESFEQFLQDYVLKKSDLYAIAFLAEQMAKYIDENQDKSTT